MTQGPTPKYVVDPADPRAPPTEVWEAMTEAERAEVCAALPSAVELGLVTARYEDVVRRAEEAEAAREEVEARLRDALAEIERLKKR